MKINQLGALAQEALDVQDASNLSGVVHSFSRTIKTLWEIAHAGDLPGFTGTKSINEHPIAVLFASKIASLTNCENSVVMYDAYTECQKLAKPPLLLPEDNAAIDNLLGPAKGGEA